MAIQTNVVWDRTISMEEHFAMEAQLNVAIAAGTTSGIKTGGPSYTLIPVVRVWTTTDAANAWITYLNTFSPAPVTAIVTDE
jgi:hypothetical protein